MVRISVRLEAASARAAQDLLDALRFLIPATQRQAGCLSCNAWTDSSQTVHYIEEWAAEPDVSHRVRSDAFTRLLSVLELSRNPRVQFDFGTSTRGLDYVVEERSRDTAPGAGR
jgi:quinol monooxygenase YgiN